jgi:hypothetical protein
VLSFTAFLRESFAERSTSRTRPFSHLLSLLILCSRLVHAHDVGRLLDEAMPEDDLRQLQEAEEVCRKFLAINLLSDEGKSDVLSTGVKGMLEVVLGLADETNSDAPVTP